MSQNLTRVIVTTDMEVDDMNSLVHLALYLNVLDVQAVVYTASQYHFLGDGVHTLGEVNPHWRTKGVRSYTWDVVPHEPDPEAGSLMEYRPFPEGWIESLWSNEYAQAWPQLQANAAAAGEPSFPTPAQMIERTYMATPPLRATCARKRPVRASSPTPSWMTIPARCGCSAGAV